MRMSGKRTVACLVTLAVLLGLPSGVAYAGSSQDNIAQVINTTDNAFRHKSKVGIAHNPGPDVLNQNIADSRASCVRCRTVAVAAQVVLVEGPATIQPYNLAFAYNEECTECETYAYAKQVVLRPGKPIKIGDRAEDRIENVERQIKNISRSRTMTFPEMDAALDAQVEKLVSIVQAEINRAGGRASRRDFKSVDEDRRDN